MHVLIILLLSGAKNAKELWQCSDAGETVRGLQAGQSWQEPRLISLCFMINRRWRKDLGWSVAVKLAESKRLDSEHRPAAKQREKWRGGCVRDQCWQMNRRLRCCTPCTCSSKL